ncbi:MAG: hypothetical protein AAFX05_07535 [Planctomycetota bacterium]
MKSISAFAVVACAGVASAQVSLQTVPGAPAVVDHSYGFFIPPPSSGTTGLGDAIDVAISTYSSAGGALLTVPVSHEVDGEATELRGTRKGLPDLKVASSINQSGLTRTIIVEVAEPNGNAMAPAGLTIGGSTVDCLFFELPNINAGADAFEDLEKAGAATGVFELFNTSGEVVYTDAAGIIDKGTSFGVTNGIETQNGEDIFGDEEIAGARFTITYQLPTPGAAGLACVCGLGLVRRRQR